MNEALKQAILDHSDELSRVLSDAVSTFIEEGLILWLEWDKGSGRAMLHAYLEDAEDVKLGEVPLNILTSRFLDGNDDDEAVNQVAEALERAAAECRKYLAT
jgi:hypothetical protein